jgi:hypothetical protein
MVILKNIKMKQLLYFIVAISFFSCSIDNYEAPQLTLEGKIVDSQTGELVESGGVNAGTVIKLYEDNSTQPLIFNTMPEGTFTNSKVFGGNYNYIAEGPFKMAADGPQNLVINKSMDIEIPVIPNVRVDVELVDATGSTATVNLQYEKVAADQPLVHLAVIWSEYRNPNNFTFSKGDINLKEVESMDLTSGTMSFTIEGLKPGTKYYIRGSARTDNPGNYYNYSSQIELVTD